MTLDDQFMRGLTIYQPWAAEIAEHRKRYETRWYATSYRGPLAIHEGRERKYLTTFAQGLLLRPDRRRGAVVLEERPAFSLGSIVAVCWLERCIATEEIRDTLDDQELLAGDWSPGRFGWDLRNVFPLPKPVPARGMQGPWTRSWSW